ncbi:hypothetical protein [Sulfitobacter guttiformis]|uniref:Uncharacterized protein n=1 Tax=Sulfitobacter guttiformis TaxID=74349 RepID=A0A420DTQ7_9RHOB|nr:hypothetical protein [Sulfitobacter guttiformis]KIN71156.1 hypothetical protein Z949_313 [Sulfitobacter guttiformis KCTC 32187]RKE97632.1 hypothetical protein C8N30_2249 [Sulfitobacter guttiformis]
MSRWSTDYEAHAIHTTVSQTLEWAKTEHSDGDADFQNERRRLVKVLENLQSILGGIDPEFAPNSVLEQVNQILRHQHVWQQLEAHSSNPAIQQLQTANNHITQQAHIIYNLAAMSRSTESAQVIRNSENAFESFAEGIETKRTEVVDEINNRAAELSALEVTALAVQQQLASFETSLDEKLLAWQTETTNTQTEQLKQFTDSQIEKKKQYEDLVTALKERANTATTELTTKYTDRMQAFEDAFSEKGKATLEDVDAKHKSVLKIHNLVARDSVTGGYKRNADDEQKAANTWRLISMATLVAAVAWLLLKYRVGFEESYTGILNWPDIMTAGSITAILLVASGYASRQSKLHRHNESKMRWFELETAALGPFIADLPVEQQQEIKRELIRRMFGQQHGKADGKLIADDATVKTLVETLADVAKTAVNKISGS